MPLRSDLFRDDAQLNACLEFDEAHVLPGAVGNHVLKIQMALETLDNAVIDPNEKLTNTYGDTTTTAVVHFKTVRGILNFAGLIDTIVGKKTIKRMDDELVGGTGTRAEMITTAFTASRRSLGVVQARLQGLAITIDQITSMQEPDKSIALAALLSSHARDILVIARRLLVSADPLSQSFRNALQEVQRLIQENLNQPFTVVDQAAFGRCDPAIHGGVPFAATQASDPDPRVSMCDPFFTSSRDLQRDVITHEYFHLLGLGDHAVATTQEGLTNANTVAQIVALIHDRFRQQNSDGREPAIPPLPSP